MHSAYTAVSMITCLLVSPGNRPKKKSHSEGFHSLLMWLNARLVFVSAHMDFLRYKMRQEMGHARREGRGRPLRAECNWGTTQREPITLLCPDDKRQMV